MIQFQSYIKESPYESRIIQNHTSLLKEYLDSLSTKSSMLGGSSIIDIVEPDPSTNKYKVNRKSDFIKICNFIISINKLISIDHQNLFEINDVPPGSEPIDAIVNHIVSINTNLDTISTDLIAHHSDSNDQFNKLFTEGDSSYIWSTVVLYKKENLPDKLIKLVSDNILIDLDNSDFKTKWNDAFNILNVIKYLRVDGKLTPLTSHSLIYDCHERDEDVKKLFADFEEKSGKKLSDSRKRGTVLKYETKEELIGAISKSL